MSKSGNQEENSNPAGWDAETANLERFRASLARFAAERDWDKFHSPRNLVLALMGEVGELAELFQWHDDSSGPFDFAKYSSSQRDRVAEELADCALYLVRLSDRCQIDLGQAMKEKMEMNAAKYPASVVRGSSKKYNEYENS